MICNRVLGTFSVAFLALTVSGDAATQPAGPQAAAAVNASPELVGALSKEIGATAEQAAGAAGALFGVAKSRLSADQFSQLTKAVPGMDALLAAAPSAAAASGGIAAVAPDAGSEGTR